MSMCPICEQYLCYVHNVVWIPNFHVTFVQIFVQINQLKKKKKRERRLSPWTRKFSGYGDETPICSSEQGKLVQIEDEVKALDKTKWGFVHVQPKDEQIFYMSNPWMSKCLRKSKFA